jgi:TonB family protein
MRHHLAVGSILVLTLSASYAQQSTPALNTLTAMNHVGEVADVCGHVAEYVCRRGTYMTLVLAPVELPNPLRIAILRDDLQSSGHVVDRFLGQTVCVRGKVEKVAEGLQVSVPDATHVEVQTQDRVPPPAFAADAFSACDRNVVLPFVIREVKPQYTARAMRAGVMGRVAMRAVIDAEGRVRDVDLMRSVHPELDEEAIRALRQWVFRPGTYMGKPVPVVVVVDMTFTLRQ